MVGPVIVSPGFAVMVVFEFFLAGWIFGYLSCMAMRVRLTRSIDQAFARAEGPRVEVLPIPIRGDD